jgi:transcriptional regulator with XRE-family HTH domain
MAERRRIMRPHRSAATLVGRRSRDLRRRIGAEIRQLREDAGISQRRLSAAVGIDHGYLSHIERGEREPSLSSLVAIGAALGADLSVRLYPTTGPRLRDPIQARILEALLRLVHPGWDRMVEVPVTRPARGVIDTVFLGSDPPVAACTEIQSELRRLEQLIRWANEKAVSLPSAPFWDRISDPPRIDRLLVVRSSRANREVVARFSETLRVAYPGRCAEAYASLRDPAMPWPGSTVLWAHLVGDDAVIVDQPPRTVSVGR